VRIVDLAEDLVRLSGVPPGEIAIVYSGLRPGEKLEEHLWEPGAVREPIAGDDVFRVREPGVEPAGRALAEGIAELASAAAAGDRLAMHKALSDLVPTFVSSMHGLPLTATGAPDGGAARRGGPS
jgi:FlaA1/EpsC-like NDP-sugar epimerase